MGQRFKVETELEPEDLKSFDAFLRDNRPKVNDALEWIVAAGYKNISRSAVYGYMVTSQEQLQDLRIAAESANAWMNVARESGATGFSEAALTSLSQYLMQSIFEMNRDGEVDAEQLVKLSTALRNTTSSNQTLVAIREAERKAAREEAMKALEKEIGKRKSITADDIAEVRKAVFG